MRGLNQTSVTGRRTRRGLRFGMPVLDPSAISSRSHRPCLRSRLRRWFRPRGDCMRVSPCCALTGKPWASTEKERPDTQLATGPMWYKSLCLASEESPHGAVCTQQKWDALGRSLKVAFIRMVRRASCDCSLPPCEMHTGAMQQAGAGGQLPCVGQYVGSQLQVNTSSPHEHVHHGAKHSAH